MKNITFMKQDKSRAHNLRWWTLAVLSISIVIATIDETIVNVTIPSLQKSLGASFSELQWVVNAYMLVFGGLLLTMGSLCDRYGRARLLRIGLAIFGLASLAAAYSQSPMQLIIMRAMMGMGGAMMMPATLSIIANVFEGKERAKAISIWAAMAGSGIALGPVLGGIFLQHFYWGSVFLLNVPIAGIAILASLFLVPNSRDSEKKPLDIPGVLLSMGSISTLILSIIEGPEWGIASPWLIITLSATLILSTSFVLWEKKTKHPMLDFSLFRVSNFSIGIAAIGLAFFAMVGFFFGFTQYLQFVQNHDPLAAGLLILPSALGLVVGAISSESLAAHLGSRRIIFGGLLVLTGTFPIVLFWQVASSYWMIGSVIFMIGIGTGTVFSAASESVMSAIQKSNAGVASAVNDVAQMLAGAFSVAVVGSIMHAIYSTNLTEAVALLPLGLADTARNSIGSAFEVAALLSLEQALTLKTAAKIAFTSALKSSAMIGAVLSLIGVGLIAKFMPAVKVPDTIPNMEIEE